MTAEVTQKATKDLHHHHHPLCHWEALKAACQQSPSAGVHSSDDDFRSELGSEKYIRLTLTKNITYIQTDCIYCLLQLI